MNLEEDNVGAVLLGSSSEIKEGDIVSVDCGVKYKGHFTDACRTVAVGEVSKDIENLLVSTEES